MPFPKLEAKWPTNGIYWKPRNGVAKDVRPSRVVSMPHQKPMIAVAACGSDKIAP